MSAGSNSDFRDWAMEVETSASGVDARGLPYIIWRESADNRLGLGRPRYCCITVVEDELHFAFFNPSGAMRPSRAGAAFSWVAVLVALAILALAIAEPRSHRPYHMDMSTPPFVVLVMMFLYATMLGGIAAVLCNVVETYWRWLRDGFKGDGSLTLLPWRTLQGFVMMNAVDTPAGEREKMPPHSYGLGAAFDDGAQLVLTANAWNHRSMAERHRIMTRLFITARAEHQRRWREAVTDGDTRGAMPLAQDDGVPAEL